MCFGNTVIQYGQANEATELKFEFVYRLKIEA